MLNNIMKLDNIISNAVYKTDTISNERSMSEIHSFIKDYCQEKMIIISTKSRQDYYILYSFDPYLQSLDLCKKLYDYMKYIKLITSIYQKEFIIMNIFKPFIVIRSALVNRTYMLNLKTDSYPDFLYSIFQYKEMYNYKNCKEIYNNISKILDDDVLDFCKEKDVSLTNNIIDNIHNSLYRNIIENIYEFLDNYNGIVFLDNYAYKRLQSNKIVYSDIINIIYNNIIEISYVLNNRIKDYMKANYSDYKIEIHIRQYNNMNFDDFRLNRTCISLKYFNDKKNKTIELINIFNSTSYDPIPVYFINDNIFPHVFVLKRFILIYLCVLFIYKPYDYKQKINNMMVVFNKYDPKIKNIKYIGTFKLESYDKKQFNKGKHAYPYIPYIDKTLNNILED